MDNGCPSRPLPYLARNDSPSLQLSLSSSPSISPSLSDWWCCGCAQEELETLEAEHGAAMETICDCFVELPARGSVPDDNLAMQVGFGGVSSQGLGW
jgi:hypothetical protein